MSRHPSLLDHILILWSENGPTTVRSTTGTGMSGRVIQLVAVIVGELFAWGDVTQRDNPHGTGGQLHGTVRVTRMINVTCFLSACFPVDIRAGIELKDIVVALR